MEIRKHHFYDTIHCTFATLYNMSIEEWKKTKLVGVIGMGDMGRLFANHWNSQGWKVLACDQESHYERLKEEFADSEIEIVQNGHYVSRKCDYILYCVEAENIGKIVSIYGPSTKVGSIVGGQTSCKAPEMAAFEAHLPSDVDIISCHSLHGPKVNPEGMPLVIIRHRNTEEWKFEFVQSLLESLKSKIVYLSAEQHDKITADTQAVTHAAFLTMGKAWQANGQYPWQISRWIGGLENAKMNISLRIYSNKWHVYAGLAISNPAAKVQIQQYASSAGDLYKLMITGKEQELLDRLTAARDFVFGGLKKEHSLLLSDEILEKFSLGTKPLGETQKPNSHLSLLSIVDSWHKLKINPYDHVICSTPLFRIWLGVTEYVFCTPGLLEQCIKHSITNQDFRPDDLEFVVAARTWSKVVSYGSYKLYEQEFNDTQKYFAHMFPEATRIGNEMINTILSTT
jgi:prephenate dehydrogenase (NADP+)